MSPLCLRILRFSERRGTIRSTFPLVYIRCLIFFQTFDKTRSEVKEKQGGRGGGRAPGEDPKGEIECDFREVSSEELLERLLKGKKSRRKEFRGRPSNTSGRRYTQETVRELTLARY